MAERVKQASMSQKHRNRYYLCSGGWGHRADLLLDDRIECFPGHPVDLLDRHYQAAISSRDDAIVKIPSDCRLIDAGVIDRVLTLFVECKGEFDYASNLHPGYLSRWQRC